MLRAALALSFASTPSPHTAADLFAQLSAARARTKAEVLAALPEEMKRNFVLVRDSRSRQRGTPDLPRVLHFTKSADLVASSSGHSFSQDQASNDLELMELDRDHGTWRMARIHFDGNKLSAPVYNERNCLACHGSNPRPLWGEFASWPTAYGSAVANGAEVMEPTEHSDFQKFLANARTTEGYRHLELAVTEQSYALTSTTFAAPNTTFTSRLGARHAEAIFGQISRAPLYGRLRSALIAATPNFCPANTELDAWVERLYQEQLGKDADLASQWSTEPAALTITKVLRLLKADPFADFRLDDFPRAVRLAPPEQRQLEWNHGSDTMLVLTDFLVLNDLKLLDATGARLRDLAFASSEKLLALDQAATAADYRDSLLPQIEKRISAGNCAALARDPGAIAAYSSRRAQAAPRAGDRK